MPYVVSKASPRYYQITFEDILNDTVNMDKATADPDYTNTITRYVKNLDPSFIQKYRYDYHKINEKLRIFNETHAELFELPRKSLYRSFKIPKKNGKKRKIDAPLPSLKSALSELSSIFQNDFKALYHTSAFAYIKGRSTVGAIRRHQRNDSNWFLKLDFSDFFGSTTEDFVLRMFSEIFPFSEVVKLESGLENLKKALSLCFLNGGLPQGTPISPLITNIMMIPVDHYLSKDLKNYVDRMVYTRYADDILISSPYDFDYKVIENRINEVLKKFEAPFSLKNEKTRYGSRAGQNWNLGVMLNKDNNITIGWREKDVFKSMLTHYIHNKKSRVEMCLHDVQILSGKISYYRSIEKDYIDYVIKHYGEKFGIDIMGTIKSDLKYLV